MIAVKFTIDVVALGELLIAFTCVDTDAGGYPSMAAHPGGAPANFLAALTKYGAKTALLGKVGNGLMGKQKVCKKLTMFANCTKTIVEIYLLLC